MAARTPLCLSLPLKYSPGARWCIRSINSGFDKKLCAKFSRDYLRNDGIFLMYVISKNSTNLVVADLIKELWKIFKSKHKPHSNNVEDEPMMNSEKEPLSGSHLLNSSA